MIKKSLKTTLPLVVPIQLPGPKLRSPINRYIQPSILPFRVNCTMQAAQSNIFAHKSFISINDREADFLNSQKWQGFATNENAEVSYFFLFPGYLQVLVALFIIYKATELELPSSSEIKEKNKEDKRLKIYNGNIYIPLPLSNPLINDTDNSKTICDKIDLYFDEIIQPYPEEIKKVLQGMYYKNSNVMEVRSAESGILANWNAGVSLGTKTKTNTITFTMVIDFRLVNCPIFYRLLKIHEIAVHIGQFYQLFLQTADLKEDMPIFRKFTEQSAALLEIMNCNAFTTCAEDNAIRS